MSRSFSMATKEFWQFMIFVHSVAAHWQRPSRWFLQWALKFVRFPLPFSAITLLMATSPSPISAQNEHFYGQVAKTRPYLWLYLQRFLADVGQIEIVKEAIARFARLNSKNVLVVVDPAMGDDGALYPTLNSEFVTHMRALTKEADVITPITRKPVYCLINPTIRRLPTMTPCKTFVARLPVVIKNKKLSSPVFRLKKDKLRWRATTQRLVLITTSVRRAFLLRPAEQAIYSQVF